MSEMPIRSDAEILARIRAGLDGEQAAEWIEHLVSALRVAQDRAMENGAAASRYKQIAEINLETVKTIQDSHAQELVRLANAVRSHR